MAVELSALASLLERLRAAQQQQQASAPAQPPVTDMPEWSRSLDPNDFQGRTREEILKAQAQAQAAKGNRAAPKGDLQMTPELPSAQPPIPMPKPAMSSQAPAEPVQPPMPQQVPPARPAPQAVPASLAAQPTNLYDDNVQLMEPMNLRKELGPEVGGVGGSYIDMQRRYRQTGELPGGGGNRPPANAAVAAPAGGPDMNWSEGQEPSTINNYARSQMARYANARDASPAAPRGSGGGLPWRAILGGAGALMQELDGQRGAMGNFVQARNARIGANREANQTRQAAIDLGMDPELVRNMPTQALMPLLGHLYKERTARAEPTNDIREFEYGQQNPAFNEWRRTAQANEYGLTPIYGVDAQGNTVVMQPSKSGGLRAADMPEGVEVASGVEKIDMGTQWAMQDRRTGQIVGYLPKDIEGQKAAEEIGKQRGEAQMGLSGALAKAEQSIGLIDQMIAHPGRATATGLSSWADPRNYVAGTDAANFDAMNKQLQGKAFLEAYETLKGGGQITQVEGEKAQAAMARLATTQSDEVYVQSLLELRGIIETGKERLRQRAGQSAQPATQTAPTPAPNTTSTGVPWRIVE